MRASLSSRWLIAITILLSNCYNINAQDSYVVATEIGYPTYYEPTAYPVESAITTYTIPPVPTNDAASTTVYIAPSTTSEAYSVDLSTLVSLSSESSSSSSALPSDSSSSTTSFSSSSTSPSPSASPTSTGDKGGSNNTAIIVGCVVGGVVGIALIGGILVWINRRGERAKRSKEQKSNFEDYGLGDFPHHRNQNSMAAAAVPATTAAVKPVTPIIPRTNEQGNYYNEDPNYNYHNAGYNGGGYPEDHNNKQHKGYHYPKLQQQHDSGSDDDVNFYYDDK